MARYSILVTGGAGFIGSHLVESLVKRGNRVRVLDDFSSGHRSNLAAVRKDVEILRGNCADPSAARRAVRGIEVVYHEGAVPSVAKSVADPRGSFRANAEATSCLLVAARDAGVRRFVYAGSSSVYGDTPGLRKRETEVPRPLSPYAVGKLTGEHLVRVFSSLYGLEGLTLRYFNVFGPRQDPNSQYSAVIPIFVKSLIEGNSPTIHGDGEQSRDFTFVSNVVNANLIACEADVSGGKVYNIACGGRYTLNELYRALREQIGSDLPATYGPPRAGDVKHSMAAIGRIQKELGYEVGVSFEEGIARTVRWYQEVGLKAFR